MTVLAAVLSHLDDICPCVCGIEWTSRDRHAPDCTRWIFHDACEAASRAEAAEHSTPQASPGEALAAARAVLSDDDLAQLADAADAAERE